MPYDVVSKIRVSNGTNLRSGASHSTDHPDRPDPAAAVQQSRSWYRLQVICADPPAPGTCCTPAAPASNSLVACRPVHGPSACHGCPDDDGAGERLPLSLSAQPWSLTAATRMPGLNTVEDVTVARELRRAWRLSSCLPSRSMVRRPAPAGFARRRRSSRRSTTSPTGALLPATLLIAPRDRQDQCTLGAPHLSEHAGRRTRSLHAAS